MRSIVKFFQLLHECCDFETRRRFSRTWERIKIEYNKVEECCLLLFESEREEDIDWAVKDLEELDECFAELQWRVKTAMKPVGTERKRDWLAEKQRRPKGPKVLPENPTSKHPVSSISIK